MEKGYFVLSLDFELFWGLRDTRNFQNEKDRMIAMRSVIEDLLELFVEFDIECTWATVGALFLKDKNDWHSLCSKDFRFWEEFSAYMDCLDSSHIMKKAHFAIDLVEKIKNSKGQRIGTHTFSHFYCLEKDLDVSSFRYDLNFALKLADRYGIPITSIIFPKNQVRKEYLAILKDYGITSYRGTEDVWFQESKGRKEYNSIIRRALRFTDSYLNLSGQNVYDFSESERLKYPMNIKSSSFLRPYSRRLRFFENWKLQRIKKGMTYAARHHKVYHLWFHPHNFGADTAENMINLRSILQTYSRLSSEYGMKSVSMEALEKEIRL